MVDFSTSEVFGVYAYEVREGDITSLGAVGEARWTYAVSKLATEHLAHNYYRQHGMPTLSIRLFNIYGPGEVGRPDINDADIAAVVEVLKTGQLVQGKTLEDDAWIGPGAVLSNGISIGTRATVTMGAVVTRDVPPPTRVSGNFAIDHERFLAFFRSIRQ